MLRPHVEGHLLGDEAAALRLALHLDFESRETHPAPQAFSRLSRDVEMPWYSSRLDEVLAQRMAEPVLRHEDAAQVGMARRR